jgi:hypothetical protein
MAPAVIAGKQSTQQLGTKARNVALARHDPTDREDPTKEFPMKCFLIAALSASALSALATTTPVAAQATAPGSPRGSAPVSVEGYGPSSAIVCDQAGTTCWHSVDRYDYPPNANVVVHPYDWQADSGANYAWREHPGRGYWQGDQWTPF